MGLYGVLVELDVFSEVSVSPQLIGPSSPTLPAPPPTTLLGALAYPYLRKKKVSEVTYVNGKPCSPVVELISKVHYASAGFYARTEQRVLERVNQTLYLRRAHLDKLEMAWTVAQRGITIYADDKLYLFYIVSDPRLIQYAWGITRVGRKESIVVVRNVIVGLLEDLIAEEHEGLTIFYTPKNAAEWCEGASEVRMNILDVDNLCKIETPKAGQFYIPDFDGMKCRASENGVFLRITDVQDPISNRPLMILVPKDVIRC